MPLDAQIDDLYRLPLAEFTAARNALAKTLKGDQAARVKGLEKPTVVPWAVNQLYWRERKTFDRLFASGRALRAAQIAALKGKGADLRAAAADHRTALADTVATATQNAAQAHAHPQPEALSRMLEALSLAPDLPSDVGRLTAVIQPAGFEALAGVTPVARPSPAAHRPSSGKSSASASGRTAHGATGETSRAAAEARRNEKAAAAHKAAQAAVHASERQFDRARAALARADANARAVRQQLEKAEHAVEAARREAAEAEQELTRAREAAQKLTPQVQN